MKAPGGVGKKIGKPQQYPRQWRDGWRRCPGVEGVGVGVGWWDEVVGAQWCCLPEGVEQAWWLYYQKMDFRKWISVMSWTWFAALVVPSDAGGVCLWANPTGQDHPCTGAAPCRRCGCGGRRLHAGVGRPTAWASTLTPATLALPGVQTACVMRGAPPQDAGGAAAGHAGLGPHDHIPPMGHAGTSLDPHARTQPRPPGPHR